MTFKMYVTGKTVLLKSRFPTNISRKKIVVTVSENSVLNIIWNLRRN